MQKKTFFFIVGRPRSGTTLLLTLLDANPHVIIPVEWPVISKLLPVYGKVKRFDHEILKKFLSDVENCRFHQHYGFQDMNFNHAVVREKILQAPPEITFSELIELIYTQYNSLFEKKEVLAIGDKNPVASRQINQLIRYFPEAKFIHIVRDYRDHAVSMINAGFGKKNLPLIVYRWYKYQKILSSAAERYPEKFFVVRYEDLVDSPEDRVQRICNFLGIPYYPEMLEFQQKDLKKLYPRNLSEQYQKSLLQPINKGRIGLWKDHFTEKELKIIDYIAGEMADQSGYTRNFTGFSLKGLVFRLFFAFNPLIRQVFRN